MLITGGTGALAGHIARHLVERHDVRHLVLASRRGPDSPGADTLRAELENLGATVTISACDTAERGALTALLTAIPPDHPLTAVLHTAATLQDATLTATTPDALHATLTPKIDAAHHLHQLTHEHPTLRRVIHFSSIAATTGNPGQASYAAANAYLDALAHHHTHHTTHTPTTSLAWGLWNTHGLAHTLTTTDHARLARHGITPLDTDHALALLDQALRSRRPALAPIHVDHAGLRAMDADQVPEVMRALVPASVRRAARTATRGTRTFADEMRYLPAAEREQVLLELVRSHAATVLGHGSETLVASDRAFRDMGFDSLAAVELRNRLSAATGFALPPTAVFDYPTVIELAGYLRGQIVGESEPDAPSPRATASTTDEPVVIVGMACRFPGGVTSPEEFWRLVAGGADVITPFPSNRGWNLAALYNSDPDHPGTTYVTEGGFLHDADQFDADFFGISPREAAAMDPQQRLLLEIAWESLERAGIDPATLRRSDSGVFVGAFPQGYGPRLHEPADGYDGYRLTGGLGSVASGRIAYAFGLEGPAMTVDTACSSSLVAVHLAVQSLQSGECSLALAGGVTVMPEPGMFIEFSRQRGLAPDGRCKSFADAADGTAWAEGAGLLVLERLSDAERLGHPIHAVIRGSAVNQDGASNGLTAPNGPSQERVIRQALMNAGLLAHDVDAVEAHGTGTTLGDPIEAQALLATYGRNRPVDQPLWLGSVKSNIGHTQAAAGVAGIIKMVKALEYRHLPRTLHLATPSRHVDWTAGAVRLLTAPTPWPVRGRPRRAAVSAFGISGTNAHLILEQPPAPKDDAPADGGPAGGSDLPDMPLLLSARTEAALRAQARNLHAHLGSYPDLDPQELARTLASKRLFEHRAVVALQGPGSGTPGSPSTAVSAGTLTADLAVLADGGHNDRIAAGRAPARPRLAFLYSGQGGQRPGMGAGHYRNYRVFRDAVDEICALFDRHLAVPLHTVLFGDEVLVNRTAYAQPALFTLQAALTRLLAAHGIIPDLVAGHSIGEISAGHAAGVFTLPDAVTLVAARATLMDAVTAPGAMSAFTLPVALDVGVLPRVPADVPALQEVAEEHGVDLAALDVAAVNTPTQVVLAGDPDTLAALTGHWTRRGGRVRSLAVSHAFHSRHTDPILSRFHRTAETLTYHQPHTPLVTTTRDGHPNPEQLQGPDHWTQHIRGPVYFSQTLGHLDTGHHATTYLEIGPDTTLTALTRHHHPHATALHTLHPAHDPDRTHTTHTTLLHTLHTVGHSPTWSTSDRTDAQTRTSSYHSDQSSDQNADQDSVVRNPAHPDALPTYPFQHHRHWLTSRRGGNGSDAGESGHGLVENVVHAADDSGFILTGTLSTTRQPWLAEHTMRSNVILPAAAFLDLALYAASLLDAPEDTAVTPEVEELTFESPLVVTAEPTTVQVVVRPTDAADRSSVTVYSRAGETPWVRHATGLIGLVAALPAESLVAWPPPGATPVDVGDAYQRFAERGYRYGPVFQGLTALWTRGGELFAEVELTADAVEQAELFGVHPALLDAAMHPMTLPHPALPNASAGAATAPSAAAGLTMKLPFTASGIRLRRGGVTALRVCVRPAGDDPARGENAGRGLAEGAAASLVIADSDGTPVAEIDALLLRPLPAGGPADERGSLFEVEWTAVASPAAVTSGSWTILGSADPVRELTELAGEMTRGRRAPDLVFVPVTGGGPLPAAAHATTEAALALAQWWVAQEPFASSRLVFTTTNAIATTGDEDVSDLAAAPVWGLIRTAHSEHPDRFALVDLDERADVRSVVAMLAAALAGGEENQLAVRAGVPLAPRLVRVPEHLYASTGDESVPSLDRGGTVLITGGTGALAGHIARHLVERHDVRHLVLASRRGPDSPGADTLRAELENLGATVTISACDTAERGALTALLTAIPPDHPLTAVLHTAATLQDATLTATTPDALHATLTPKIDAAHHLHQLTHEHPTLRRVIHFSSIAATTGNPGQASYAAANAYLDALAHHHTHHTTHTPTTSLAWGLWNTHGLAHTLTTTDHARLAR
ncbi:type I polyketide synthase, partial [Frankia sp. AgB1.8]